MTNEQVTAYVCGLLFRGPRVYLTKKTRPDWQKHCWNGCGGKIEAGETPSFAMNREGREEMKIDMDWDQFFIESGPGYVVHFFRGEVTLEAQYTAPANNDVWESIRCFPLTDLPLIQVVGNLNWLIPMACDWRKIMGSIYTKDSIRDRPIWTFGKARSPLVLEKPL